MLRNFIGAAVIVAALGVTGCASVPMASPEADRAAKAFTVDSSKANLYIYRSESMGAAVKMPVLLDNNSVGSTAAKTYIFRQVEPGSHQIVSNTENTATLTVDAKAGENIFVWQEVKMGAFSAGSALHRVDDAKGKAEVAKCKLVQ
jgi:hypothetical protein